MKINKLKLVYFSAANTTQNVLRTIAEGTGCEKIEEYDIIKDVVRDEVVCAPDELLIVGVPVYSGRVPQIAKDSIARFKGNNTPAIIVCVYGNRAYEDALLELKDIVEEANFKVISAAAFIARHSIFPQVANDRPNADDLSAAASFGRNSIAVLSDREEIASLPEIQVSGSRPYREVSSLPLQPSGNKNCNLCGTCVKACPTQAIPADHPRKTDKRKCISCAHCIAVCKQNARNFRGIVYIVATKTFVPKVSKRKEIEVIYVI